MSDSRLERAARKLNERAVAPPTPPVELYPRARSRQRRRAVLRSVAVAGAASATIVLSLVVLRRDDAQDRLTTSPTVLASTPPRPPPLLPHPESLVAHLPTGTGVPGKIVQLRSDTGAVIRVLGEDYDPYVGNGFHVSATAAYWEHLDQPHQTFPITEARLADGVTRTVAEGGLAMPSPDGRRLLVMTRTIAVVDLETLQVTTLPVADTGDQTIISASWLPDGHSIVAVAASAGQICSPPAPVTAAGATTVPATNPGCPRTTVPRADRAWVVDASIPSGSWRLLPATQAWQDLRLLGPGRLPGTVAAATGTSAGSGAILTMDMNGSVVDRVGDDGLSVLAVDRTGTNFWVLGGDGHLARVSLADPRPVVFGPVVAEAAWW